MTLPNGTAVLSYPPSMRPIRGDKVAVSVVRVSSAGAFQLYLNAAPREGPERLQHWAAFRLRLLRSGDAASAHEVAAAEGIEYIHLHLWLEGYRQIPTDGPLFLVDAIAAFVLAAVLLAFAQPLAGLLANCAGPGMYCTRYCSRPPKAASCTR